MAEQKLATLRSSNFELLRIIAILMVLTMHFIAPCRSSQLVVNQELTMLINAVCNTGVTLFMLISGWFGLRWKAEKCFHLWYVTLGYTIPLFFVTIWYTGGLIGGGKFILNSFFPVLTNYKWFITSYIIVYALSPFINRGVEALDKKEFGRLLVVLYFFFYVAPSFLFLDIMGDSGKGVINLMVMYLTGRYLRTHGFPDWVLRYRKWIIPLCIVVINASAWAFTLLTGNYRNDWAADNSVLIMLQAVAIFSYAVDWKVQSDAVNRLAKYCFPLFLINNTVWLLLERWINPLADSYMMWAVAPLFMLFCVVVTMAYEAMRGMTLGLLEKPLFSLASRMTRRLS